jgi:hypothetical protein
MALLFAIAMWANRTNGTYEKTALLATAARASAPGRSCGRSAARLLALPMLDRLAAEAPVTADAEPGQASLPEQAVDSSRMDPQVVRQFPDSEDLILRRYLRRALRELARRRSFLRRPFIPTGLGQEIQFAVPSLCWGISGVKTFFASSRLKLLM